VPSDLFYGKICLTIPIGNSKTNGFVILDRVLLNKRTYSNFNFETSKFGVFSYKKSCSKEAVQTNIISLHIRPELRPACRSLAGLHPPKSIQHYQYSKKTPISIVPTKGRYFLEHFALWRYFQQYFFTHFLHDEGATLAHGICFALLTHL
jgi:hypothetical protein